MIETTTGESVGDRAVVAMIGATTGMMIGGSAGDQAEAGTIEGMIMMTIEGEPEDRAEETIEAIISRLGEMTIIAPIEGAIAEAGFLGSIMRIESPMTAGGKVGIGRVRRK